MTQPDWDDDRLDAAFHARYDRPAPTTVAHDVHVRIAGTSPARFALPRVGQPWSLAAAAVIVVLVGAAMFVPAAFSLPGASAGPSALPSAAATSAPGASATPTEQALPGSLFDGALPIVDVRDAIALRDSGADDREIAVHGWFTPAPPISCGGDATKVYVSPVQLRCPDQLVWLTEDAESLIRTSGSQTETVTPSGPAINPDLDTMWVPDIDMPVAGGSTPVDVVFVGHFDDRRAALCPRTEQDGCRDRFVVDSVAMVRGATTNLGSMRQIPGTPSSTDADIARIIANETPDSPILSMVVVDGPTGLAAVEPSLGTGQANLIDRPILWIVRVLESDREVTYVVIDGTDAIYEINPAGEPILVGGTPPSGEATGAPTSWPPTGARSVALTSEVGAGQPPVQVAVLDRSGRLGGVAETGTVDPSTMTLDRQIEAYPELNVSPGRVHLVWVGSICDKQITVTVAEDIKTITFDMGPVVDCDSMGVERELVLDFSGLLDVPSIELVNATNPATPAPSAGDTPSYELDCGPLGPDTCQAKAANVIAATPEKRVVSIAFSDECGSYRVTFDDGNWTLGEIDCIPGASPG